MNRKLRKPIGKNDEDQKSRVQIGHESAPNLEVVKLQPRRKLTRDRCCYATPDQKSFSQITEPEEVRQYYSRRQHVHTAFPDPKTDVQELKRVICNDEKFSTDPVRSHGTSDLDISAENFAKKNYEYDADWQIIDDLDSFILTKYGSGPKKASHGRAIHISEVPRVKVIAEKFTRYKQNNVELRKLDEKMVCVEYDVFEREGRSSHPAQIMRAFFTIKPKEDQGKTLTGLPSTLRNKIDITFNDLKKLSEKEVEMIDGKIAENLPYLEDLRKLLKRKEAVTTKPVLDLQTLYELALMELTREHNLLTKEELQVVKDLILRKCRSSIYGVNRKVINDTTSDIGRSISQAIMSDMFREDKAKE